MKSFEKLSFSRPVQTFISFILYIIFCIYSIQLILTSNSLTTRTIFTILLILLLMIALFSEYIKHLYRKALKTLLFDLNPKKAKNEYDELMKIDKFKTYKNERIIFDSLYYLDQMEYDECINFIENHSKFFHSSIDQLLIYHYTKFYCSYMMGENDIAIHEYQKLKRMKDTKVKGAKVSPLYNWEFLEGVYHLAKKEYKQSFNLFKSVNTKNMNPREQVQYYYQYALAANHLNNVKVKQAMQEKIKELNGHSTICQRSSIL